jgi:acetate kinase
MTTRIAKAVLILNAGSSSLKFAVLGVGVTRQRILWGYIQRIGLEESELKLNSGSVSTQEARRPVQGHAKARDLVLEKVGDADQFRNLAAVGHCVLRGGENYTAPHVIDASSRIEALVQCLPKLPQVACLSDLKLPRVS